MRRRDIVNIVGPIILIAPVTVTCPMCTESGLDGP
jgi:hypothetical protein